jgi:hypothetical protein
MSIDREKVPRERWWREEVQNIGRLFIRRYGIRSAEVSNSSCGLRSPWYDVLHARFILSCSANAHPLLAPFGGRPVGAFLKEAGILSHIVRNLITGHTDMTSVRKTLLTNRRQPPRYWAEMALRIKRRWRHVAATAAERAITLTPDDQTTTNFVRGVDLEQTPNGLHHPAWLIYLFKQQDRSFSVSQAG